VLDRPHLRPHARNIVDCLQDLIPLAASGANNTRAIHAKLKLLGLSKLGWRQEVHTALLQLTAPIPNATSSLPEPALEPTVYTASPLLLDVLREPSDDSALQAAMAIAEMGFVACRGGMPKLASAAWRETEGLYVEGRMQSGKVARGAAYAVPDRYSASVPVSMFLDRGNGHAGGPAHDALSELDGRLLDFATNVIRELGRLGVAEVRPDIFRFARADDGGELELSEAAQLMVSVFPGNGTSYAPHIDNVDGDHRPHDLGRCFACLYYMNSEWDLRVHGGAFRAYLPSSIARRLGLPRGSVPVADVSPECDVLLMFRADKLLHEVQPALRQRLAATLWLCARSTANDDGAPGPLATSPPDRRVAQLTPLYPQSEYGRCVNSSLAQHPFRPIV
jgi:hypothetical protein